jgi:hypothetical protein
MTGWANLSAGVGGWVFGFGEFEGFEGWFHSFSERLEIVLEFGSWNLGLGACYRLVAPSERLTYLKLFWNLELGIWDLELAFALSPLSLSPLIFSERLTYLKLFWNLDLGIWIWNFNAV